SRRRQTSITVPPGLRYVRINVFGEIELDQPEHEEGDDRRDVEPAHARQPAPDRPEDRLGNAIEKLRDRADELITGIDDVERDQPGQDCRCDQQIDVEIDDLDQNEDYRAHQRNTLWARVVGWCLGWSWLDIGSVRLKQGKSALERPKTPLHASLT